MISVFDLLTYPLILLGLFRGSFQTYKCLSAISDETKQEQLQYWVVMSALLFLFPWIDCILGWFLFSGVVGCVKLGLLIMVVVSRSNYGFVYLLIEEQFLGFIEPYINQALDRTKDYRTAFCDTAALFCNGVNQYLLHLMASSMSDKKLSKLKKRVNKTVERITRELRQRDYDDSSIDLKSNVSNSNINGGSKNNNGDSNATTKPKSIFEQASEADGGWSGPIAGGNGLRKRNNAKQANATDL